MLRGDEIIINQEAEQENALKNEDFRTISSCEIALPVVRVQTLGIGETQSLEDLAIQLFRDDKILPAARILQNNSYDAVSLGSSIRNKHECTTIIQHADACERLVACLEESSSEEWSKVVLGGTAAHYGDTVIYYKSDNAAKETVNRLQCRLETPISESLLVPIISVLNESELYHTWVPTWKFPIKFGIRRVEKLRQVGRCSQVIIVTCDLPWPLSPREIVLRAIASDDIDERGLIYGEDGVVPPVDDERIVRLHLDGGFLIQQQSRPTSEEEGQPHPIMLKFYYDVRSAASVPLWFLHFVIKNVLRSFWEKFLKIAEGVRDGSRILHVKAIEEKKTLYDWVIERTNIMLSWTKER